LPWDKGLDNTVSSIALNAREQGLTGINLLRVNSDGLIHYGQHDGDTLKEGTLDARQAANTPADDSQARMAQLDQQAERQPPQHQTQHQTHSPHVPIPEPMSRAM
jgi:hypothetical protein